MTLETRVSVPQLSEESLEAICVALAQAKNKAGLRISILPRQALQEWIVVQLPVRLSPNNDVPYLAYPQRAGRITR